MRTFCSKYCCILGLMLCTVCGRYFPTFRNDMLGFILYLVDGGSTLHRNLGKYQTRRSQVIAKIISHGHRHWTSFCLPGSDNLNLWDYKLRHWRRRKDLLLSLLTSLWWIANISFHSFRSFPAHANCCETLCMWGTFQVNVFMLLIPRNSEI
jgi:hypothetical protein